MTDLKYRIGGIKISPDRLKFGGFDPYNSSHKFVVEALDDVISIYIAEGYRHSYISEKFSIRGKRVGGGSCYLDNENRLVLNDYSVSYYAIPKEVAQKFAELIIPELNKLEIKVTGIVAEPKEILMNSYWKKEDEY